MGLDLVPHHELVGVIDVHIVPILSHYGEPCLSVAPL